MRPPSPKESGEELIDDHRREIANDRYCDPTPVGDGLLAGGVADE